MAREEFITKYLNDNDTISVELTLRTEDDDLVQKVVEVHIDDVHNFISDENEPSMSDYEAAVIEAAEEYSPDFEHDDGDNIIRYEDICSAKILDKQG